MPRRGVNHKVQNITFQQVSMFLEVAKRLNITAVAEDMYVSQAALSKTIQRLEDNLKMPLFDRSGRNLKLTPQGKLLYSKLQAPFESICNSIEEIQHISRDEPLSLKIGYLSTIDLNYDYNPLNKFISEYKSRNPELKFQESIYSFDELKSKLSFGDLDLIFIPNFELYNFDDNGIDSKGILKFRIFIAVGENNPARKNEYLDMNILRRQPLYTVGTAKSPTMSECLKNIVGYNIEKSPGVPLPNNETLIRTLKSGNGFSLLGNLQHSDIKGIKLFPVEDTTYAITLHMAWRTNNENRFLHRFIKSISNSMHL